MQLFRTLCVVAVLGALTYGAYVTLTGSPPVEPPLDAVNWDSPPHIELPAGPGPLTADAGATAPGGHSTAAPKFDGQARLNAPTDSLAGTPLRSTITNVRPSEGATGAPPTGYPSTNAPPGPFDTAGSQPLAAASGANALPGASLANVDAGTVTGVTPVAGAAPLSTPSNTSLIQSPTSSAATPTPTPTPAAPTNNVPLAELESLAATNPAKALEQASKYFDDPKLSPEENQRVTALLDYLAGAVIYSREHLLEPAYTVQPGDRLDTVAAKYDVSPELLAKINGTADPNNLAPGTQLKVVRGPFGALVDRSRGQLSVFLGPLYAGSFAVGFGQALPPRDGQFAVQEKLTDRATASPASQILYLNDGLAIHANGADPLTEQRAPGCIRLNANDLADVFDILSVGSPVIVRQ